MLGIDLTLLGSFAVAVDGAAVPAAAWPQRRPADLVKLLALAPGHRLPRERVLDALWPHLEPQQAAAALHKAAHYARRALGAPDAVVLAGGLVALAPEGRVTTDVARFEAGDDDAYAGDLLPDDLYESWAHGPRERLRALALGRLRAAGRWEEVVALDAADEEAYRQLMRQAARAGDRGAAARAFARLRTELAALGMQPSQDSQRLLRELARGPAVTAPLGEQLPMTGRASERAAALSSLEAADAGRGGVLLLVGEAGSGKTRLAEAILHAAAERRWHTVRAGASDAGAEGGTRVEAATTTLLTERPDLAADAGDAGTRGEEVLARAAGERGCAVLLDDLHAAGDASVDDLLAIAASAAGRRLLVIAAWQPSEARDRLREARADLRARRLASEIELEPVDARPLPQTRYATAADGARIAYQVVGEGDLDIVLVPGFVSNIEHAWEMPVARRMYGRLAARSRLILWDKRGTGLSDPTGAVPTLDERMLDLTAVLDGAGSAAAVLFGVSEGGAMSLQFAARHPERVVGLALYGTAPRFMRGDTYPSGWDPDVAARLTDRLFEHWGTGSLIGLFAPSRAGDPADREVFGRFQRAGASPTMGRAMVMAMLDIDVRDALASIRAPTLAVHRAGDRMIHPDGSRVIADAIPGATYVELPGTDHFPFLGDMDDVIDEVEVFLDGLAPAQRREGPGKVRGAASAP